MPRGGARPGSGRKPTGYITETETGERKATTFNIKQIEMLLASPHVAYVSRCTISFTIEFKQFFWKEYCTGVSKNEIFRKAGIDPEVLGAARIKSFSNALCKQMAEGQSLTNRIEPAAPSSDKESANQLRRASPVSIAEAEKLRQQIAYLQQEVEFIKKIISTSTGGKCR